MLNETQRVMLETTIRFPVEDIIDTLNEAKRIDLAGRALEAVTNPKVYNDHRQAFDSLKVLDTIHVLRDIYAHPAPQNRSNSNPDDEFWLRKGEYGPQGKALLQTTNTANFDEFLDKYVVWHDQQHQLQHEPKGLLSLTSQNDGTAAAPDAGDVGRCMVRYFEGYAALRIKDIENAQLREENSRLQLSLSTTTDVLSDTVAGQERKYSYSCKPVSDNKRA